MSTKGDPDRQGVGGRVSPIAPESASLSAAVWNYLESSPGFNEGLRQSEAELEGGGGVWFEDVDDSPREAQHTS